MMDRGYEGDRPEDNIPPRRTHIVLVGVEVWPFGPVVRVGNVMTLIRFYDVNKHCVFSCKSSSGPALDSDPIPVPKSGK